MNDFRTILSKTIAEDNLLQLVLSKPVAGDKVVPRKITIRPVSLKAGQHFQFTRQVEKQELHDNHTPDETLNHVTELLGKPYRHAHLFTPTADYEWKIKKSGEQVLLRLKPTRHQVPTDHNRKKCYLIPEGTPCPFLHAIGVMTQAGRVHAAHQHKFRQINKYLEIVSEILPALPAEGTLQVVDFGSGKSYLTFALHHLLTQIHQRDVQLIGVDRNQDLVSHCQKISEQLQCQGLQFVASELNEFELETPVHLSISLHACDTATDLAIAKAIDWQSHVVLAVPCCQHELAPVIETASLQSILKHGILKERFAAMATDSLRAAALEICGYRTQVMEFIDLEHTAKNILLRAVRRKSTEANPPAIQQYKELKDMLHIEEWALERALGTRFQKLLQAIHQT